MKRIFGTLIYFISIIALVFMVFEKDEKLKEGTSNYESFIN